MLYLFALAAMQASAEPARIELVCVGSGAATGQTGTRTFVTDSNGNQQWVDTRRKSVVPFADQVNLWVEEGRGSIRLPRSILPTIHGGKNGWFDLRNVKISDREIDASAAVSFLDRLKVRIDRVTGSISINGDDGDYHGQCERYDPSTPRKF